MVDKAELKRRLWQEVDLHREELVGLTSDLLRINTENPPGNSRPITEYVARYLDGAGIDTAIHVAPGDHHNLLGEISTGRDGRRLLFCGHTDVVPAGDESRWDFSPTAGDVVDGYLRGRGASDMKAGVAAFLFAATLLNRVKANLSGSIGLVVVDDEEVGGQYGAQWVLAEGFVKGNGCIIAEPSGPMNPTIGQKGSCWFEVTFFGTPAHGSMAPLVGDNAILKACAAAQQLQKLYHMPVTIPEEIAETVAISKACREEGDSPQAANVLDHVSVNVGIIRGGTKANIVPDRCTIEVDTRVPFGLTHHDVMAYARKLLDELGHRYEIRPLRFQGSANYTSPRDPVVVALLQGVKDVRGGNPFGVLQWATSDARYFRDHGIPVLQYGPAELPTIHSWNERVKVEDVVASAKVYAATAVEYLLD